VHRSGIVRKGGESQVFSHLTLHERSSSNKLLKSVVVFDNLLEEIGSFCQNAALA
jgi:hypothetical protein